MRYNNIMSANPHDHEYRVKVEHIFRAAPEASKQLEKHLKHSPQLKSVVVDCVNSIFNASING